MSKKYNQTNHNPQQPMYSPYPYGGPQYSGNGQAYRNYPPHGNYGAYGSYYGANMPGPQGYYGQYPNYYPNQPIDPYYEYPPSEQGRNMMGPSGQGEQNAHRQKVYQTVHDPRQKSQHYSKNQAYSKKNSNSQNNNNNASNHLTREDLGSDRSDEEEEEDEELLYQKTKAIAKKRDPVMDTPEEIKKWIEARKRNYPTRNKASNNQTVSNQMSILESKIRKKIMLVTSDGRGIMKKLKNMHILKRLINEPNSLTHRINKNKKETKVNLRNSHLKDKQKYLKDKKSLESKQKIQEENRDNDEQSDCSGSQPIEIQIKKQPKIQSEDKIQLIEQIAQKVVEVQKIQTNGGKERKISSLTPEDMIKHLKEKQNEDKQFYEQLLDYKTNSLNYKYTSQTLETNFLLEHIFEQSSYLLQIVRYIAKNNFFQARGN